MKALQAIKAFAVTPPGAIVDNAAFTTATIDTLGFNYVRIICLFGAMDIAMAALKLTESDDSGMSGATDVPGMVYGTSTNLAGSASTLPSATSDNTIVEFQVDLRGRKRYLDVSATGGDGTAGTYLTIIALLGDAEETPTTTAEQGAAQILRG